MAHPDPFYWYALKDRVKLRCRGKCEWCNRRTGAELHHRHYRTWGREQPEDVMLLCAACHAAVGGHIPFGRSIKVNRDSLAAQGDNGHDPGGVASSLWQEYLRSCPTSRD